MSARTLYIAGETPALAQDERPPSGTHHGFCDFQCRQLRTARIQTRDDLQNGRGVNGAIDLSKNVNT